MKISTKTVESYIGAIKLKFQAKSKGEIVATAIQFAFTHILTVNTFKSEAYSFSSSEGFAR